MKTISGSIIILAMAIIQTPHIFACSSDPGEIRNLQAVSGHVPEIPSSINQIEMVWDDPLSGGTPDGFYAVINSSPTYEFSLENTIELELLQNVREYLSPVFSNVDDERFYFHIAAACIDPVTYIMHFGPTKTFGAIRIDTVGPLDPKIIAPTSTASQTIEIQPGATHVSEMYISNLGYDIGGIWENFSTSRIWHLTDGTGIKTIYAQFRDDAGNTTTASTTIEYDPYPHISQISEQSILLNTVSSIPFAISIATHMDILLTISSSNDTVIASNNITLTAAGAEHNGDHYTVTVLADDPLQCYLTLYPQAAGESEITLNLTPTNGIAASYTFFLNAQSLSSPENLTASNGWHASGVLMEWNPHDDADYFQIYRGIVDNFSLALPISAWLTDTIYSDTSARPGQIYYYWVKAAINEQGDSASLPGASVIGYVTLQPPDFIYSSKMSFSGGIGIYWNDCPGATHYFLYRNQMQDFESAIQISSSAIEQTSYMDTNITQNISYYYWVKASNDSSGTITSQESKAIKGLASSSALIEKHQVFTQPEDPKLLTNTIFPLRVFYENPEHQSLTQVMITVHFNSKHMTFSESSQYTGLTITLLPDENLFDDGDPTTDQVVHIHWTGSFKPEPLCVLSFTTQESLTENTRIHFSAKPNAQSEYIYAGSRVASVVSFTLDIDGNGYADALSDGLAVLFEMAGILTPDSYTRVISLDMPRHDLTAIKKYIDSGREWLDIDGNGKCDALTDGLLILRYLFCFSQGDSLVQGAVAPDANRHSDVDIAAYLRRLTNL
jgi:hypothetical protein